MSASADYLRELDASRLGDAVLSISLSDKPETFRLEIFKYDVDSAGNKCRVSSNIYASRFQARFQHGNHAVRKANCYHPIFDVPATDYTYYLLKAWTGKKEWETHALKKFARMKLQEEALDKNAEIVAKFFATREEFGIGDPRVFIPTDEWHNSHDEYLKNTHQIELADYQKVAAYCACQSKFYGLLLDPGLGKTAIMIRKMDHVIEHLDRPARILILCPKPIRNNWTNEIGVFSRNAPHILTLQGTSNTDRFVNFLTQATARPNQASSICLITGYESFVQTPHLHDFEWDLVLIDESHNFANPSTKRVKTILAMNTKFANTVIATGTHFRNTPFDNYAQFELFGKYQSGFSSLEKYKSFFGEYNAINHYTGFRELTGFQNIPLLRERIARRCMVLKKEVALPSMPKKTYRIATCEMEAEQKKIYFQLLTQLAAEIESYAGPNESMTVNNVLTQMLRLHQITSGIATTDSGLVNRIDPNPKLELLVSELCGYSNGDGEVDGVLSDKNQKAIVWCAFVPNLRMIQERLNIEGVQSVIYHGGMTSEEKDKAVNEFNCNPNCRVFIGIAQSGGVGLNLVGFDPYNPSAYTTNCTHSFRYSMNWSQVVRQQSDDRAHRKITRVPVQIVDLLIPGTIDFEIYERVQGKIRMAESLSDVKEILTSILKNLPEVQRLFNT